jgi:transposase
MSGDSTSWDGVMSGGSSRRYPPELRDRAVRMVAEISDQHESEWAAMGEVARLLGVRTAACGSSRRESVLSLCFWSAGRRPTGGNVENSRLRGPHGSRRRERSWPDRQCGSARNGVAAQRVPHASQRLHSRNKSTYSRSRAIKRGQCAPPRRPYPHRSLGSIQCTGRAGDRRREASVRRLPGGA